MFYPDLKHLTQCIYTHLLNEIHKIGPNIEALKICKHNQKATSRLKQKYPIPLDHKSLMTQKYSPMNFCAKTLWLPTQEHGSRSMWINVDQCRLL